MKSRNRIPRNDNSTPAGSPQACGKFLEVRQPGREFDPSFDHPSCLAVYDRVGPGVVEKIPLSEDEFYELLRTPGLEGGAFYHFVADAIREKLSLWKASTSSAARSRSYGNPSATDAPTGDAASIAMQHINRLLSSESREWDRKIIQCQALALVLTDPAARAIVAEITKALSRAAAFQTTLAEHIQARRNEEVSAS